MKAPARTIARRKSWPAWARWYAEGPYRAATLFSAKPHLTATDSGRAFWSCAVSYDAKFIRPVLRCRHWTKSIRKIINKPKG